jgi:zinc/manganese transport system permease protein
MEDFLRLMTWPFLSCLLMAGILVNFGIHVIERQVIFVDLALAQIAAFGAVFGVMLGWDIDENALAVRGFSLVFAILGAAVFSLTRSKHAKVPHEAVIGITYAVAFAATILATSRLGHGAEEVDQLLAGSILFVDGKTVGLTALLYAAIGVMHFFLRKRFLLISVDPAAAERMGLRIRVWDFLFYVSFAFVVTSAVTIAGVLLVFSYLIIPAVIAVLFAQRIGTRLLIGWTMGALVSMVGVGISYKADLPSGPVIVVAFAVALIAAGMLRTLLHSPTPARTMVRFAVGAAAIVLVVFGSKRWFSHEDAREVVPFLRSAVKSERLMAIGTADQDAKVWPQVKPLLPQLLKDPEPEVRARIASLIQKRGDAALESSIYPLLRDADDHVRETAVKVVREFGDPKGAAALLAAARSEEDEYLKVEMGEAALELGDPGGFSVLLDVMDQGEAEQARKDAFEHFAAHAPEKFVYDGAAEDGARAAVVKSIRAWLEKDRASLKYDKESRKFVGS